VGTISQVILVVLACVLLGPSAWGLYVLFKRRRGKDRLGEKLHAMLLDAECAVGEEADLLLAKTCQECERIHREKPRYAFVLRLWCAALMQQAKSAGPAEANRLYQNADEKLTRGLAMARDDSKLRAERKAALLLRAHLLHRWGASLMEQAIKATIEDADRLYESAEEKLTSALVILPDDATVRALRYAALLEHANLLPGAAGRRFLERVCQDCETRLAPGNPQHAWEYADWGCALWWLAFRVSRAEAEQFYAKAEEKFTSARRILPSYETATAWLGLVMESRARLRTGEEEVRLREKAMELLDALLREQPSNAQAAQLRAYCLHGRAQRDPREETNRRALEAIRQLDNVAPADANSTRVSEARALLLWAQARCVSGERRAELLRETERAYAEAESLQPRSCAYSLAVVHALLGEPEECRRWLEVSREPGCGVSWDEMATDPDLESVRKCEWFRDLLGEEAS
jgi:tetratricopeptide (TPR) repeat protein